jgi:hypothetical protein
MARDEKKWQARRDARQTWKADTSKRQAGDPAKAARQAQRARDQATRRKKRGQNPDGSGVVSNNGCAVTALAVGVAVAGAVAAWKGVA